MKERYRELQDKYHELSEFFHKKELEDFRTEFLYRKESVHREIDSLNKLKTVYKKEMKQGLMTNTEYQQLIAPLTKKRKEMELELSKYRMQKTDELIQSAHISIGKINEYLSERIE